MPNRPVVSSSVATASAANNDYPAYHPNKFDIKLQHTRDVKIYGNDSSGELSVSVE